MPKHYTMGGRAAGAAPGQSPSPGPRSLRERVGALRNLSPFIKLVWQTSPSLTAAECILRLGRALLPVATLYVGKLIIDEVIVLARTGDVAGSLAQWYDAGRLNRVGALLVLEFALAVCSDVFGRTISLLDSLLSEQFSN